MVKKLGGSMDLRLKGARVIVTAGAGGIGLKITERFLAEGASVYICDIDQSAITSAKQQYPDLMTGVCDVSDRNAVSHMINEAVGGLGGLDCLVNNAGITQDNLAIRMNIEEWKKVIDINLTSTFLMSKFAIKKMLKNKSGKIVNITSVVGHTGNIGQTNYTASKAGIVAMSKSLAIEYAKKNININCISPGFIKTAMTEKIDEKFKEVIISKIPSARLGDPDDIANAVLFLASDQSNYINGETIHINGGMYMA